MRTPRAAVRSRVTRARTGPASVVLLAAVFAAAASLASPVSAADAGARNNEGNALYKEKRYDDALKKYTDAQALRPEAPELHYNIGNVLYRKGEYEKAMEEYLRAQSTGGRSLSQSATFNRGNALMMKGQVQDAINAYIQALRADPSDKDAKRNLELALRLQEQQKQQQQQQDQQQDQQNQQDQKQPQQQPQNQDQRDQKQQQQKRPGQMSEDEARQILEALKESEKEGIRKHAQATSPRSRTPEEDW